MTAGVTGASFCSVLSCTCVGVPGLALWQRLQFSTLQASSPLWQEPQNWPSMIFSMLIWLPPALNSKPRSAWHTLQRKRTRWNQWGKTTGRMPAASE